MEIRELHISVRGPWSVARDWGGGVRGPGSGVQAFVEALLGRFTRKSRFRPGVEYVFWALKGGRTSYFFKQDRRVIDGPRIELTLICCSGAEPVTMNRTSEAANVSRSSRRETAGMRWELVDRRVSGRETGVLQSQMNATIRESHERNLRLVNRIVRQYARRLELLTKDEMSASENGHARRASTVLHRTVRRPAEREYGKAQVFSGEPVEPGSAKSTSPDRHEHSPQAASLDVERLTDQVVRSIDRRIMAHRERLGRI